MKIGLTGSIACGKSAVSQYLRELGYFVADADAISRSLTAPGGRALPLLREAFGDGIFDGDVLNRRRLGDIVFGDADRRAQLNAILHPLILSTFQAELEAHDAPDALVFGDVPLLYECNMAQMFDRIMVVSAPRETQIARLLSRDGLSREDAERRIDAQMPLAQKCALADAVINTDGPMENTRAQVRALIDSIFPRRKA
ncbi:MAG: dephospho-CoA kinase [Clostridiales bacterium]|nr:dephospho-CoA kinase [Clostridiales bacterium]MDY3763724.1 dephospho-CoA kinase [Candidatus Ventricola sp.]MCI6587391.1 dephospho-CoA kinase [Clostridiales bacterium]MCI7704783.1 dephospho-CoA kinase [Clostridiales bacterium]MDY4543226.1 dephospho-CoA kinase [Candidatus Ventricola sp.]